MSSEEAAKTSPRRAGSRGSGLLSAEEKAAMRETLNERRRARAGADGEADVLAKIAEMPDSDRALAERVHAIVRSEAPGLAPRTWYGMPAYTKDGKVICFFQSGAKFSSRYATFGFQPDAKLDDGDLWPTAFAVTRLTPAVEKEIGRLVRRAAG